VWQGSSLAGWAILAFLAVGPTIGGFGLYTVSLTYLPASVASIIATLEPVMTTTLAFFLLGERLTPPQWAGSLLIISGVVLLRLRGGSGSSG
jgi:drug/metabolite transporter (DMT)-like permease